MQFCAYYCNSYELIQKIFQLYPHNSIRTNIVNIFFPSLTADLESKTKRHNGNSNAFSVFPPCVSAMSVHIHTQKEKKGGLIAVE